MEAQPEYTPESFVSELRQEAAATRRLLERIPEEHLSWKPHSRSMSLGQLALHIADLPAGITELLKDLEQTMPAVPLPEATSVAQVLETLDESVDLTHHHIESWSADGLQSTWRLRRNGTLLLELPRGAIVRTLMLNHWYHHRGQMTVYLRLLDVPLPPLYGPTADESL